MDLVESVLAGNRLALARLLSKIENDTSEGDDALHKLFPYTGRAHLIGITGAPGTGKSSLANQLGSYYRQSSEGTNSEKEHSKQVAIVAVDPSSPFTGGAVMGDRIRMRDLSGDPGVFIRSMTTRGAIGGLAHTTSGLVQAFDAAGFDLILIETVGAGQAEVDVARLAHTTIVVEAPGLGDDIQAIKAGILEIADIFVVNKADRPTVENTERTLRGMLKLAHPTQRVFRHHGRVEPSPKKSQPTTEETIWIPPILQTIATEGDGIPKLAEAIARHRKFLQTSGDLRRRERARLQNEIELRIQDTLLTQWRETISNGQYEVMLDQLVEREISPLKVVEMLIR